MRGNVSGKHGNSAGIMKHSPAGNSEAVFGNVPAIRRRRARDSGRREWEGMIIIGIT
jgi:hypothetical protein